MFFLSPNDPNSNQNGLTPYVIRGEFSIPQSREGPISMFYTPLIIVHLFTKKWLNGSVFFEA